MIQKGRFAEQKGSWHGSKDPRAAKHRPDIFLLPELRGAHTHAKGASFAMLTLQWLLVLL
jgi:hypothetical protein